MDSIARASASLASPAARVDRPHASRASVGPCVVPVDIIVTFLFRRDICDQHQDRARARPTSSPVTTPVDIDATRVTLWITGAPAPRVCWSHEITRQRPHRSCPRLPVRTERVRPQRHAGTEILAALHVRSAHLPPFSPAHRCPPVAPGAPGGPRHVESPRDLDPRGEYRRRARPRLLR